MDLTTLPLQPPAPLPTTATDAQRAAWVSQWQVVAMLAQAQATTELAEVNRAWQSAAYQQASATNRLAASNEAGQAAREAHAQAQADTAISLDKAAAAQVEAARIHAAAMVAPVPSQKISRARLAAEMLPNWPHVRADTPASAVAEIIAQINAIATKYPTEFE